MTDSFDQLLDDLFQSCAFTAFLEQAALEGAWPDRERTRQRAYALYEEHLALKSSNRK